MSVNRRLFLKILGCVAASSLAVLQAPKASKTSGAVQIYPSNWGFGEFPPEYYGEPAKPGEYPTSIAADSDLMALQEYQTLYLRQLLDNRYGE